jgi:hypothetical protein
METRFQGNKLFQLIIPAMWLLLCAPAVMTSPGFQGSSVWVGCQQP